MSDIDTSISRQPGGTGTWLRRGALAAVLLGSGVFLGAAGFATAQGAMGHGPWQGGHGPRLGMVQFFVRGALENVGATSDQETKVHDIIATAYQKIDPSEAKHDEMRKQVLDILRAPTIDRAAAETLRAQKIADMDAKSKVIVGAALDAAAQLTPEQRVKLAQNAQHMAEHDGWHRWGGEHRDGGPDQGPVEHGPMGHGPDGDQR